MQHVFDYTDGDVHACVADVGWITGHSYIVYGPLMNGGTTLLFESTPVYPDPGMHARCSSPLVPPHVDFPRCHRALLVSGPTAGHQPILHIPNGHQARAAHAVVVEACSKANCLIAVAVQDAYAAR